MRHIVIEQIRFLSTVFLCSEFTLRIFTLEYMLAGKGYGNLYLRKLTFAHRWKNRKNFVPHGR